jgi:prolyl oligopeptidase PreP (S9A serine peptidase family)
LDFFNDFSKLAADFGAERIRIADTVGRSGDGAKVLFFVIFQPGKKLLARLRNNNNG